MRYANGSIARKAVTGALAVAIALGLSACAVSVNVNSSSSESTASEQAASSEGGAITVSTTIDIAADDETTPTVNGKDDGLCSWNMGGTDASSTAGDDYAFTPVIYVNGGSYDAESSLAGEVPTIGNDKLADTAITINKEAVNGVIVNNSSYALENVDITVNAPNADGTTTCDFSGLGAALAAYGNSDVSVRNSKLNASGVAGLAVFCDNGASVLLDNVELNSAGGTLHEGYVNSPSQPTMVAPPWILGIMGTSRGTNLMGTNSTMTVMDSSATASNWAALSTDAGSNMALNVVNTSMALTGSDKPMQADGTFDVENPYTSRSGYGTYAIGKAKETFLGVQMQVGTYATIFTGGSGYYGNLVAGESYDLLAADGTAHTTYTAADDVRTTIESDTFGFMAHKGTNTVDIDGATVHSAYTNFLVKSGNDVDITVRGGADVRADNGILLQLMDNDDSTTSYDNDADAFGVTHEEYAGFPAEAVSTQAAGGGQSQGAPSGASGDGNRPGDASMSSEPPSSGGAPSGGAPSGGAPSGGPGGSDQPSGGSPEGSGSGGTNHASYTIEDTALEGAMYNGIGWKANDLSDGNVAPMTLSVALKGTATLRGPIASTSCIHASYDGQRYLADKGITAFDSDADAATFAKDYQLTSFSKSEYFNIGQVANLVSSNGLNDIDVALSGDAMWTVSGTSLIASLSISDNAQVIVEDGVTLTVGGKSYQPGTYTAADFA